MTTFNGLQRMKLMIFLSCFLDERRNLIIEINRGLDEANETLEQIGLEINQSSDISQKSVQENRLKSYYAELKRLEEDYNKFKNHQNVYLDEPNEEDFSLGLQEDQKRRLLDNSDRLERTGNQIEDALRLTIETEEIGSSVLNNLSQQRDTIQKGRNRLRETNAELSRSGRLMNMMIMRSVRDKFALYIILAIFILSIVLTIYFTVK